MFGHRFIVYKCMNSFRFSSGFTIDTISYTQQKHDFPGRKNTQARYDYQSVAIVSL